MDMAFAVFQWTTLAVLLAAIGIRIWTPNKRNMKILGFLIGIAIAVLLAIPMFYAAVDQMLGGKNMENFILRLLIFAAFYLLGTALSRGYGNAGVTWAIRGPVGLVVLGLATALLFTMFLLVASGNGPSSAGLLAQKQLGVDAALIMLLIALIGIVLLPILQGIKVELSLFSLSKLFIQYLALCLIATALTFLHFAGPPRPSRFGAKLHVVGR